MKNIKPPNDSAISGVASAHDLAFQALGPLSWFVSAVMDIARQIPGLTSTTFISSLIAAADCLLGPVQLYFVTEVDQYGQQLNVASNVSSAQTCNVAPYAAALSPHTV
jgi:hypothetical protein